MTEVSPKPGPVLSDFAKGMIFGLLFAAMAVGFMAAGSRSQNPTVVINALLERGVPIDPRVQRLAPPVRRSLLCVALNVHMESRGEPEAGRMGVAWVTRTRSAERDLSPCDVVFEWLGAAQFSWTSYTVRQIVSAAAGDPTSFLSAQDIAWRVLIENETDPTHGANHFWGHRAIRPPGWSRAAAPNSRTVIGGHTFIRIARNRTSLLRSVP